MRYYDTVEKFNAFVAKEPELRKRYLAALETSGESATGGRGVPAVPETGRPVPDREKAARRRGRAGRCGARSVRGC